MNVLNRVIFFLTAFIMNACFGEADMDIKYKYDPDEVTPVQIVKGQQGWSGSRGITAGGNSSYGIQAQFEEIGQYTVQFELSGLPRATGDASFKAEAEIIWSVAGNSVRRLVNCNSGMSVSGTAEAVSVKIVDDSNLDGGSPFEYVVSVQIAPGTRPSVNQPPYFYDGIYLVAPGDSQDVEVPLNAGVNSVYVLAVSSLAGGATDPLLDGSTKIIQLAGATGLAQYDPTRESWVPLAPGADTLRFVVSPTATSSVRFTPFFGIDG